MGELFTSYLLGGLLAGFIVFLLLFRFWNLPAKIKSHFKLNSRMKIVLFIVLAGFAVAILVTVLVGALALPETVSQVIEGVGIGFSCAIVVGVLNASGADSGKNAPGTRARAANRQAYPDNKGRRSKG